VRVAYWKNPLEGKRNSPSPLVVSAVVAIGGSSNNDATNRPTHLKSSGDSTSKRKRNDLTSVGWCVGDEDTPRHTLEGLSNDEDGE